MTNPRVRSSEVTLGQAARASIERYGINEPELRLARACSISTYETPQFLIAIVSLRDGRRVELACSHALPGHIVNLRLT